MVWLWILIAIIVVFVLIVIYYYNKIVVLGNRIDNAFSQIDVQLKKRNDLIPNLVATVKGYAKHEKGVFEEVTKARASMLQAKGTDAKFKASDALSNTLKSLFAVAEAYPQLRANENFKELQQELSDVESKIAYTRQFFNDSVLMYNDTVLAFPGNLFAGLFGKTQKDYLKTAEAEKKVVNVNFD